MNKELDFVKDMFDKIAPRYDFLNRLLSLRQDVVWRTRMVKAAGLGEHSRVLDVACGTCDVGLEILKQTRNKTRVVGIDFSGGMLALARKKMAQKKTAQKKQISLTNGDALCLPFGKSRFDAVFIAFGIRNIMDRARALDQFHRVLKPGGRLAVLELTTPEKGILKTLYLAYFQRTLPVIGSFFSKDQNAYSYLPASVLRFPRAKEFATLMNNAGFGQVRFRHMTFGIVTLFVGKK